MVSYQSLTHPIESDCDADGWYVRSATVACQSERREYFFYFRLGNTKSKAEFCVSSKESNVSQINQRCYDFLTRASDIIPFMVFYRIYEIGSKKYAVSYLGKRSVNQKDRDVLREYYDDITFYRWLVRARGGY